MEKEDSKEEIREENYKRKISKVSDNTFTKFFMPKTPVIVGRGEICKCAISIGNPCILCGKKVVVT